MEPLVFQPSRKQPSWFSRLRKRAFRSLPLLAWLSAAVVVAWLLRDRAPAAPIKALAEPGRHAVSSGLGGEVRTLAVGARQAVTAGQVVARLGDEGVRLRLAATRHELEQVRAELAAEQARLALEAKVRVEDRFDELRRLHGDLDSARVERLAVRAEREEARVRQQGVGVEMQRIQSLEQLGMASGSELTALATEHDALKKRSDELLEVLAGHEAREQAARQRLLAWQEAAGEVQAADDPQLTPFRWQIRAQEVALELVALEIDQHTFRAPAAGVVETLHVVPGQWLAAGQPLLTIVEAKPRAVVAYVPEVMRAALREDTRFRVARLSAPHGSREAAVLGIGPAVVCLPQRLWADPRLEEWGLPVYLQPGDDETPGERLLVRWR